MSPGSNEHLDRDAGPSPVDAAAHRRRIVWSILAGFAVVAGLALPAIVLLGGRSSSASFADSEVLSANRLGAAVLDIEVEAGSSGPSQAIGREAIFSAMNLAPGDRVSGQLAMTNAGDLPFRYRLAAVSERGGLGQWLRFEVWAGTGTCSPDQPATRLIEDVQVGSEPVALVELARPDGINVLEPGASVVWCLGAVLPLDTPNEAQGQRLDLSMLVTAEHLIEGSP